MTNNTKLKLKKMNFLNKNRRIARETETTKYRIQQVEKTDDNIYRLTRGRIWPQYIQSVFL